MLAIAMASLLSDACYEGIIPLLPALVTSLGGGALALGAIEGAADGFASLFKLWGGSIADYTKHRRALAAGGYLGVGLFMPAIGFATSIAGVFVFRVGAWICRGFRSPIRDTLLVDGTDPQYVNRAFGFQRAFDTIGAVIGPAAAIVLVALHVPIGKAILFGFIPGLAAGAMYLWVRERPRSAAPRQPVHIALAGLPNDFKRYLLSAGIFGVGNFSATLLVLVAMRAFTPHVGSVRATALATALYLTHNVIYAGLAYPASLISERIGSGRMLVLAFLIFAAMGSLVALAAARPAAVIVAFVLAAIGIAILDPMESTFATELLPAARRGTGYGALAAVNGVGDLLSSFGVGAIWQAFGSSWAFGTSAMLCLAGTVVLMPLANRRLKKR